MHPQLTIAIDFDETFTADVDMWTHVVGEFRRFGHRVICVSARNESDGNRRELETALPEGVPVLLSDFVPKKVFTKAHGYEVDIWIDDYPASISLGAGTSVFE